MSVMLEFSIFPTDKGESVSEYVSKVIKMVDESGHSYKLNPMGTVVETNNMSESLSLLDKAYALLEPDCNRVYATAKFDIRKTKTNMMEGKINSIQNRIGDVKI
ncbi:MAG: MTH1187 family thiamine-binding protein [Bacteroidales bacterium]|nr:MTH1187 family thiamine-binding protein [Bacteroidales bacterium]